MSDVDWVLTRNDLIRQALSIVGVLGEGEDPSAEQQDTARKELDSVTKYLQAQQLFLWNYSPETLSLVNGTASYAVANNDAIGLDYAYYLSNTVRVFLEVCTWREYEMIGDPATTGTPTKVFFNPNARVPAVTFYPKPDASLTVYAQLARRLKDWDSAADNAAWPQWWFEPLKWKLAANLSYHYQQPIPKIQLLEAKALELLNSTKVDNFNDRGKTPIMFVPG